jgi:hypothetical protein
MTSLTEWQAVFPEGKRGRKTALLMSGGIGDFLHYISKIQSFLRRKHLGASDVLVCVESTVPQRVEEIFRCAFPELSYCFTLGSLHWTRTNPLLLPHSEIERIHRPAYQYLRSLGFRMIEDWFLPFLCSEYASDRESLLRIVHNRTPFEGRFAVTSARDKGFLWWPSEAACVLVDQALPTGVAQVYMGTPNEAQSWMPRLNTPPSLRDALAASYAAELFIGTDTGLATIRELTGRKCIYCISEFWLKEMMVRYHYLDLAELHRTGSVFAYNLEHLRGALHEHFHPENELSARQ